MSTCTCPKTTTTGVDGNFTRVDKTVDDCPEHGRNVVLAKSCVRAMQAAQDYFFERRKQGVTRAVTIEVNALGEVFVYDAPTHHARLHVPKEKCTFCEIDPLRCREHA